VLLGRLLERIDREGPLAWSSYVDTVLYDEEHGFYAVRGRAGRRGDFLTSPEVGPLFGAVVARLLDEEWVRLGRPDRFTVVEGGAGPGTLARSVLAAAPACGVALRYVAVERSAAQRTSHPEQVRSVGEWPAEPVGPGVVLANELLDNLPFDLVEARGGAWWEVRVGRSGSELAEVLVPLADGSTPIPPPPSRDGVRLPVQRAARAWVEQARRTVGPGRVVVIDYAATAEELMGLPPEAWLRTYRHHDPGASPLAQPGAHDVTVPVVIDQLPAADEHTTQHAFLLRHGIDALVDEGRRIWAERAALGDLAALRARSRVREAEALLEPDGLGGFTVLQWTCHTSDPAAH
jgi:SAM-dependent MidA family methyltransferase